MNHDTIHNPSNHFSMEEAFIRLFRYEEIERRPF